MLKVLGLNTDMKFTAKCITKKMMRKNAESAIATFLATEVLNICIFCKYKFLKITKLSNNNFRATKIRYSLFISNKNIKTRLIYS